NPSAGRVAKGAALLVAEVADALRGQPLDRLRLRPFDFEDPLLGVRASHRVIADVSVAADHAVAGDQQRDRILRQHRAGRADRSRGADLASDPAVGPDLAAGNLERLLQDGPLELGQAGEVESNLALCWPLDVLDPSADGRGRGRPLPPNGATET